MNPDGDLRVLRVLAEDLLHSALKQMLSRLTAPTRSAEPIIGGARGTYHRISFIRQWLRILGGL